MSVFAMLPECLSIFFLKSVALIRARNPAFTYSNPMFVRDIGMRTRDFYLRIHSDAD